MVMMIRLDPPGTFCQTAAVCDMLDRAAKTFIDVGCGSGSLSRELCRRGLSGVGVDLSADAIAVARAELAPQIASGRYRAVCTVVGELETEPVDVGISMMVAEHVADDLGFVRDVASRVRPGGQVIIGVPGRRDRWGYEDEVVGHLRRYERADLERLLRTANLEDVKVWSAAVPVANLLFHVGNRLVRRGTDAAVESQSAAEQTGSSGIREIPWKTVFPRWCGLLLNRFTLYPLFLLQRLFYRSSLGVTLIGSGRVPTR
jgi:2-polyprenyl-3-methyl-5-hydroxy-6-metoxy-1,4-benzoquinol methylase